MKKIRVSRRRTFGEPDWLNEVIIESTGDTRLSKKTPRRNRIWLLVVHHRVPGIGVALILRRRNTLGKRILKKLNFQLFLKEFSNSREIPLCGFYDDFDDHASLSRLYEQLRWTVIEKFESFLNTELGRKIQENKSFSDSVTLLIRKIQAI